MLRRMKIIDLIVKNCIQAKAGQQILVVADDGARSVEIGRQAAEACDAEGAEVVLAVMTPRRRNGQEPPPPIAQAMQACDVVFSVIAEGYGIEHSNAGKAAREKGIKYMVAATGRKDDDFDRDITLDDLQRIKERTEHIAEMLSRAATAKVTSALGTELVMSLKGRTGISLHPLSGAAIVTVPDYAEAAISPVEGTTEGVLVSEGGIRGWGAPPREPLRLVIKAGRVAEVGGAEDYAGRVRETIARYENAANCAAELGIGTTHTMRPGQARVGVLAGTLHIAIGRNNDIGGDTYSKIHSDLLVYRPTLWLDDFCLIENGKLNIP